MRHNNKSASSVALDNKNSSQDVAGVMLPILGTIASVLIVIVTIVPALASPMLFDSGDSGATYVIFFGLWTTLLLCIVSPIGGWIFWALTRHEPGKIRHLTRIGIFLLPLLSLGVVVVGFIWIMTVCSGYLAC